MTELTDHLLGSNLLNATATGFARDPHRGVGLEWLNHNNRNPLRTGHITYSLPYSTWYRVALDGMGGSIGATTGSHCGFLPLGPREIGTLPPHSYVVLWIPPGQLTGIILCAYPAPNMDGTLSCPDWISQGSQSGIKREAAYTTPSTMYRQGGYTDFNAGRPLDSTTLERGFITETGSAVTVDPFMVQVRMSEMCGLFLNYWDQHTRLAGMQLDIQSPAFEISAGDDEGETRYVESHNPYVWETLGLYAPGAAVNATFSAADVQMKRAKGAIDLPDGKEDTQPVSRYQEYGGYLGQGHRRVVMIPGGTSGIRRYSDDPRVNPDLGVFEEAIGLNGSYSIRSAADLSLIKTCLIAVPKEMNPPANQAAGEDARKDNYKFSGIFGQGDTHHIGSVDTSSGGATRHLLTVAGLLDLLSYNLNWRPLHPFYYHHEDYIVPQESDLAKSARGSLSRSQESISFSSLAGSMYLGYPTPKQIKVDDRYGQQDYYQRQAGWCVLPDGSVVMFDGYGSQITMTAGHIRFDCPGDVQIMPGRNVVNLAGNDLILRAKNSFDLTAGNKDGRIKAEKNLQVLGGNENGGGILLETKSPGFNANFDNQIGEDVVMGGIVFRAAQSSVVTWGGNIYLRTGSSGSTPGDLQNGEIVLDSTQGVSGRVVLKGESIATFVQDRFSIAVGPSGSESTVNSVHWFGSSVQLDGYTVTTKGTAVLGDLTIGGAGYSVNGFAAVNTDSYVDTINGGQFTSGINTLRAEVVKLKQAEITEHTQTFTNGLYAAGQPGNTAVIQQAMFSFRDDNFGNQYIVHDDFMLAESRWQQMARLGLGDGGTSWTEPVVHYQGQELLPWPGKKKWQDDQSALQLQSLTLFDSAAGLARDRGSLYESPSLSGWQSSTLSESFTTIK